MSPELVAILGTAAAQLVAITWWARRIDVELRELKRWKEDEAEPQLRRVDRLSVIVDRRLKPRGDHV